MADRRALPLVAGILLAACGGRTLTHSYQPVRGKGWSRGDTMVFTLPEARRSGTYRLTVGLRTGRAFPYQDLVMCVETRLERPAESRRDTIRYPVTDDEGTPLEKGTNHHQMERESRLIELRRGQRGTVRLYHLMHREVLPSVTDVGIHIRQQ